MKLLARDMPQRHTHTHTPLSRRSWWAQGNRAEGMQVAHLHLQTCLSNSWKPCRSHGVWLRRKRCDYKKLCGALFAVCVLKQPARQKTCGLGWLEASRLQGNYGSMPFEQPRHWIERPHGAAMGGQNMSHASRRA